MSDRPTAPRIPPTTEADRTDEQRELLEMVGLNAAFNIFTTLVRNPGLFRRWLPFSGKLLMAGRIPARDREIVILRVAYRCGSAYEWGQHVSIARAAKLDDDEIRRVAEGSDAGWSDHEAALIRAVDELHDDHCISDATWATLAESYDEQQLIELTMLAGHYTLLAGTLNSLGVQPDDGLPPLGQV